MRGIATVFVTVMTVGLAAAAGAPDAPLVLAATIPLPGVQGRIDHLAVDVAARRLYVAALGNNSLEVVDVGANRHVKSVAGFLEPQGIATLPGTSQVVVANGQGAGIEFRAGDDLHLVRPVALGEDADNVRLDAKAQRVYVGYGSGAIAAVDAATGRKLGEVTVGGHPESFQLEASGPRIFVNVPTAHRIAVIDRNRLALTATWAVSSASANFPMALDEDGHRLFIGCRKPAVVLIYDTNTGAQVASAPIAGDTDDLFWDAKRQRLYVSAGEGFVDVLQASGNELRRTAHVATAPGARTALFVPTLDRLFLAVPHRDNQAAEIRVYEARD